MLLSLLTVLGYSSGFFHLYQKQPPVINTADDMTIEKNSEVKWGCEKGYMYMSHTGLQVVVFGIVSQQVG